MWVNYRGLLNTVCNDLEISICGYYIEFHSVQSIGRRKKIQGERGLTWPTYTRRLRLTSKIYDSTRQITV